MHQLPHNFEWFYLSTFFNTYLKIAGLSYGFKIKYLLKTLLFSASVKVRSWSRFCSYKIRYFRQKYKHGFKLEVFIYSFYIYIKYSIFYIELVTWFWPETEINFSSKNTRLNFSCKSFTACILHIVVWKWTAITVVLKCDCFVCDSCNRSHLDVLYICILNPVIILKSEMKRMSWTFWINPLEVT